MIQMTGQKLIQGDEHNTMTKCVHVLSYFFDGSGSGALGDFRFSLLGISVSDSFSVEFTGTLSSVDGLLGSSGGESFVWLFISGNLPVVMSTIIVYNVICLARICYTIHCDDIITLMLHTISQIILCV